MNFRLRKHAIAAILIGGLLLVARKVFASNFDKTELLLLFIGLVFCGVATFFFQQRRERRLLESMRDSALW